MSGQGGATDPAGRSPAQTALVVVVAAVVAFATFWFLRSGRSEESTPTSSAVESAVGVESSTTTTALAWNTYLDGDGDFSVKLPGVATGVPTYDVGLAPGTLAYEVQADDGPTRYDVAVIDVPPDRVGKVDLDNLARHGVEGLYATYNSSAPAVREGATSAITFEGALTPQAPLYGTLWLTTSGRYVVVVVIGPKATPAEVDNVAATFVAQR